MNINSPKESTLSREQRGNALRSAIVLLAAALLNDIVASRQAIQSGHWQAWGDAGVILLFLIAIITSIVLIRRENSERGISLLLISFMVTLLIRTAMSTDLGILLGLISFTIVTAVAFITLPPEKAFRWAGAGLLSGVLIILFDLFAPAYRQTAPAAIRNSLPIVATFASLFVIIVGVRYFRKVNLQIRMTGLILLLILPLLIGVTIVISSQARNEIEKLALQNLQDSNDALSTNVSTWLEMHNRALNEMAMLPDITSMSSDRQRPVLQAIAITHPNLFLVQTTDLNGINIARNDDSEPKDYHDRVWFLGAKSGAPITYEVLISRTTGKPALNMSKPIYDKDGNIIGVASIVSELDEISTEVLTKEEGRGITYIVDANNRVVAHPDPTYTNQEELLDLSTYPPVAALREGETGLFTFTDENGKPWRAYISTLDNGWGIIAQQAESEILAPIQAFQRTTYTLITIVTALMLILMWLAIRQMVRPIGLLTETASAIAAGDLSRETKVTTQDEIGTLASTFNSMTSQLRNLIGSLEQRVAERTQSLELAGEVGRSVSQVRALDVMLKDAAEIIRSRFDLYYVQVYLSNQAQNMLVLQSGTGLVGAELVGRGHQLPLDTGSINGLAATEKHSVVIPDTTASTIFRPNPLLPDTRSEMAVPLQVGDQIVGVLDLQSRQPGALTKELLPAFEALAGQIAIAIQNARLLAETEQARLEVERQARRLVRGNWEEYMDAIHVPEKTGFVYEMNQVRSLDEMGDAKLPAEGSALVSPISITGEQLGTLVVETADQSPQNVELVQSVARQMAQQIENLRLLDSAERYRAEVEQASRRATVEGWKSYVGSRAGSSLGYLYDLNTVQPEPNGQKAKEAAVTLPLKARDETVGKLAILGNETPDSYSMELANAVADRLGTHLESLRLFEETKRGQVELDKRARQLAAVAQISTASSRELDLEKMLHTVVHLTQRQFELYHAHIFLYNENTRDLKIAACGWKEDDPHEGTDGTAVISIDHPQSLVAQAGQTRQVVIVNDVHNDPRWLPNPLLPDTRAEMAIPLVVGDQILGVLDVQSEEVNAFSEEDANIQSTLASQVATSLQNARSFAQAQQQADRESMLNAISQKIQSATSVEAVLQIAARELGHALGAPLTIAQLGVKDGKK